MKQIKMQKETRVRNSNGTCCNTIACYDIGIFTGVSLVCLGRDPAFKGKCITKLGHRFENRMSSKSSKDSKKAFVYFRGLGGKFLISFLEPLKGLYIFGGLKIL